MQSYIVCRNNEDDDDDDGEDDDEAVDVRRYTINKKKTQKSEAKTKPRKI